MLPFAIRGIAKGSKIANGSEIAKRSEVVKCSGILFERLAQLVRSLTSNQEVSGSIPFLVEG